MGLEAWVGGFGILDGRKDAVVQRDNSSLTVIKKLSSLDFEAHEE